MGGAHTAARRSAGPPLIGPKCLSRLNVDRPRAHSEGRGEGPKGRDVGASAAQGLTPAEFFPGQGNCDVAYPGPSQDDHGVVSETARDSEGQCTALDE